jgi:hypothetical protein
LSPERGLRHSRLVRQRRVTTANRQAPLRIDRRRVLARRLQAGHLHARLPSGRRSLREAAWAGLQDSAPRAGLLSLYARVDGVRLSTWEDRELVQLWGPRRAVYVVSERDRGLFSLGTLPADPEARATIEALAATLRSALAGRRMPVGEATRAAKTAPANRMKGAGATGTILIRWDGAHEPTMWEVERPAIDLEAARIELARRYLHVLGPGTAAGFARWAGVSRGDGELAFVALAPELLPVRTQSGDAWFLASDEPALREPSIDLSGARLLPSGDAYLLAEDRELLVPDPEHGRALWPSSNVRPGGLLIRGELAGTWRRAGQKVKAASWRRLSPGERESVEGEAEGFPLPKHLGPVSVTWIVA